MSEPLERLTAALADRYRIERELGEGGMATVYLADDLKHQRKVALKVLRPELAAVVGAERFLAEIRTTANLQHPHILPLFDSGEVGGLLYFVMPYVEGETLQALIQREQQLPVDEAVRIAKAVANALQTAHDQGVIHRDIKPANILMSRGEPLVADFGIALAVGAAGGSRLTETGLSVGTPFYMSPEQATGDQAVGPRADIYSLGCVLYEMLVGEPPFVGNSAQAVLGKIIQGAPKPVTEIRKSIPPNVDAALRKALERLPADRFASADDFGRALSDPGFRYGEEAGAAAGGTGPWKAVAGVAVAVAVASLALAGLASSGTDDGGFPPLSVMVDLPDEQRFLGYGSFDLSPDGTFMVYEGPGEDESGQLWLRRFGELDARPIPGTDGAVLPDVSPDGTQLVYQTNLNRRQIQVASLINGTVRTVADSAWCCPYWGDDGRLYYITPARPDGPPRQLIRANPDGGNREAIAEKQDRRNIWAPAVFRNGTRALMSAAASAGEDYILGLNMETGDTVRVWAGHEPTVTESGYLLLVTSDRELMAAPFDEDALEVTGSPVLLATGLYDTGDQIGHFAVSDDGEVLVYRRRLMTEEDAAAYWLDGVVPEFIDPDWQVAHPGNGGLALSPSGDQLAVTVTSDGQVDVVVKQLPTGPTVRISLSDADDARPSWTPDGRYVTFISNRSGSQRVYRRRADGAGSTELVYEAEDDISIEEAIWSPDGEWLIYRTDQFGPGSGDIMGVRPGLDRSPTPLLNSDFTELHPALSPDGRWLAYASTESGRAEVFVVPFPDTDERRIPISTNGGTSPRWSSDGRSLYFLEGGEYAAGDLVRAELQFDAPFNHEITAVSVPGTVDSWDRSETPRYDVHPRTGRIVGMLRDGWNVETQLVLVQGLNERINAALGDGR